MFTHLAIIETTSGPRPIREIRDGRTIMAYDGRAVVNVSVVRAVTGEMAQVVQVRLSTGQAIECDPAQPFYVPSKGYISAAGLRPGDRLQAFDARAVSVVKVGRQPFRAPGYGLTTAPKCYFATGVLVGCVDAERLQIPVLVGSQLNRQADGVKPTLAMLRESGGIENEADAVIALWPPDPAQPAGTEAVVLKNRTGETGSANLYFDKPCHRFGAAEVVKL